MEKNLLRAYAAELIYMAIVTAWTKALGACWTADVRRAPCLLTPSLVHGVDGFITGPWRRRSARACLALASWPGH
nr:unnamed protein product [Digitaria exilis]